MTRDEKLNLIQESKNPSLRIQRFLTESLQAKAISKLDLVKGEKGDPGDKGESITGRPGLDGKDGIGKDGKDGKNGLTPIKGVDYWTREDKEGIIKETVSKIRVPQDGVSPNVEEIVKRTTEEIKKNPIHLNDIKGVDKLVDYLKLGGFRGGGGGGTATTGVTSFNTRTGAVTLTSGDVTTALGFTPGQGTVTNLSVATANGFSGSVTPTTTPVITLSTTLADGSIPFITSGGLNEDNTNLTWDNVNKSLTVGSPISILNGVAENALNINGDFGSIGVSDFLAISNHNSSSYGSTDHVVSNDIDDGTVLTGTYGDFGIAGSAYVTVGDAFDQPNDVYLIASNGAGNLNIAAQGIGKRIRFATEGDTVDQVRADISDSRFTIYANKDIELAPSLVDANWTQAGGWGFGTSPNRLILSSNAGPNTISPTVSLAPTMGVTYRIVITASATSGSITYTFGGSSGTAITGTTITDFITATSTANLIITGAASATATITAVSVRALVANTGDLFIEGNLKFGSNIQTTTGANILNSNGAGVATFAQIPFGPASNPTDDNQFTRKAYVDSIAAGISVKGACRVATTVAGTLASSFENGDTVDGVVLATNDRILIKNQVAQKDNGIYTINASGAPTRATDSDTSGEVQAGALTFITSGTVNAGSQWVQTAVSPVLNTDPLIYALYSQTPVYTASNGVKLTGSDFSAKLSTTGAVVLTGAGSDELSVATDNSSLELSSNAIRVKALGITNAMLAGSITNAKLSNSSLTIGSTAIALGATSTTLAGLTSVTSTTFVGALTGTASGNLTASNISDTAYGSSWDGVTTIAPSKNAVYDANFYSDDLQKVFSGLGSSILFYSPFGETATASVALNDNQAKYIAIYIQKTSTITGVKFLQQTAGNYTADQNNYVALYSYSAGTMTQVAISANDGNLWKGGTNTFQSVAFSAPYVASPGVYFISLLFNASAITTTPTISGFTLANSLITADFTNSSKLCSHVSVQNSLPSSQVMSGTTLNNLAPWLALY